MARTNGQRSYAPEEVRFIKSGGDGRDGSPWTLLGRLIPKNILLEAYTNPCTIEELSLALGVAAPFMEEEVRRLHDGTLLARLDDGRYETEFVILDRATQLDLFEMATNTVTTLAPVLFEQLDQAETRIRAIGFRRSDLPSDQLNWWLLLHAVDRITDRVSAANGVPMAYTLRPHGGQWDMVGYEQCSLPFDPFIGHNGNGAGHLSSAIFWTYKIRMDGLWDRAGELGSPNAVALLGDLFRANRPLSALSEPERLTIRQLVERGFLEVAGDRIEPTFPVIDESQKGELSRLNGILDEIFAGATDKVASQLFEAVATRIQRDVPARLAPQVRFAADVQLGHLRMMTLRAALEAGRIRIPEDIAQSTIAMHMEI